MFCIVQKKNKKKSVNEKVDWLLQTNHKVALMHHTGPCAFLFTRQRNNLLFPRESQLEPLSVVIINIVLSILSTFDASLR